MTEDAARPPRPGAAAPDGPPPPPPGPTATDPAAPPPPAGSGPYPGPPPGGYAPPPPGAAGFTTRYGLVRPHDGRYLAGVCAAIGRATNTDPVLWRVLLAVLGFFGGIGILVYVTAWLIIPGEGDTASPVESMLGRGRSSMSPVTVIVLSIVVAISFGYVVTNAFRAILLGAVILIGGALLLNRDQHGPAEAQAAPGAPPSAWPASAPPAAPAWSGATPGGTAPAATPTQAGTGWPGNPPTAGPGEPAAWSAGAAEPATSQVGPDSGADRAASPATGAVAASAARPATESLPARPGWPTTGATAERPGEVWTQHAAPTSSGPAPAWPAAPTTGAPVPEPLVPAPTPVGAAPPPGGYRPPFAPHGPYAESRPPAPAPAAPVRAPKRPKERSALGAVTFSLTFLALGVVAVLDLLDVFTVGAAGYFAAALATIGLGLLVGTWFGRARWLIALGLVTAAALGVATIADSYDPVGGIEGDVTWAPVDYRDLAARYESNFGDAVLDLRAVDFDQKDTVITAEVNLGQLTVVVPPNVDVTTVADVNAGDGTVFGRQVGGLDGRQWESTDLGPDGRGGGTLRLVLHVNAGGLEVTR